MPAVIAQGVQATSQARAYGQYCPRAKAAGDIRPLHKVATMEVVESQEFDQTQGNRFQPSQVDLLAASLRLNSRDIEASLGGLAKLLSLLSPGNTAIKMKKHGVFNKENGIEEIAVSLGDKIFSLRRSKSPQVVETSVAKLVRGIVIKTDQVDMETWSKLLAQQLSTEAARSEAGRLAVEQLLGLG